MAKKTCKRYHKRRFTKRRFRKRRKRRKKHNKWGGMKPARSSSARGWTHEPHARLGRSESLPLFTGRPRSAPMVAAAAAAGSPRRPPARRRSGDHSRRSLLASDAEEEGGGGGNNEDAVRKSLEDLNLVPDEHYYYLVGKLIEQLERNAPEPCKDDRGQPCRCSNHKTDQSVRMYHFDKYLKKQLPLQGESADRVVAKLMTMQLLAMSMGTGDAKKGGWPYTIPNSSGGETPTSISFNNTRYLLENPDANKPTLKHFLDQAKTKYKSLGDYEPDEACWSAVPDKINTPAPRRVADMNSSAANMNSYGGRRKSKRYFRKRRKTRRRKKRLTSS